MPPSGESSAARAGANDAANIEDASALAELADIIATGAVNTVPCEMIERVQTIFDRAIRDHDNLHADAVNAISRARMDLQTGAINTIPRERIRPIQAIHDRASLLARRVQEIAELLMRFEVLVEDSDGRTPTPRLSRRTMRKIQDVHDDAALLAHKTSNRVDGIKELWMNADEGASDSSDDECDA